VPGVPPATRAKFLKTELFATRLASQSVIVVVRLFTHQEDNLCFLLFSAFGHRSTSRFQDVRITSLSKPGTPNASTVTATRLCHARGQIGWSVSAETAELLENDYCTRQRRIE
jgi:hypothetical protein